MTQPWKSLTSQARLFVVVLSAIGFALRISESLRTHLHPDEAFHLYLSLPGNLWKLMQVSAVSYHPPLTFLLFHVISLFTLDELALRMPIILAGSLLPYALFVWLRRISGDGAALCAAALLAVSPSLIALSAQLRGYMPALAFALLSLYLFEAAIEHGSRWRMAACAVSLWLAVLSEFSIAFLCAGAGIYWLLRLRESRPPMAVASIWVLGQAMGLALAGGLYWAFLGNSALPNTSKSFTYLDHMIPGSGDWLATFVLQGTLDQFTFLFYSRWAGLAGFALFTSGLAILWRSGKRPMVALALVPFLAAVTAALLHVYPYGRSRHTVVLSLLVASGVGIAVDRLLRSSLSRIILVATPVLLAATIWQAYPQIVRLHGQVQRIESLRAAIAYLREKVPPGEVLLADRKTIFVLHYYLCGERIRQMPVIPTPRGEVESCGYRLYWKVWNNSGAPVGATLADFRQRYGIPRGQPVWVADFGFDVSVLDQVEASPEQFTVIAPRKFKSTAVLFQVKESAAN